MTVVDCTDQSGACPLVSGWTAAGFEGVRDAFAANLRVGEDHGAAISVYRHGECVVDLWGGRVEPGGSAYPEDALEVVFSTTKGLTALCLAALVQDGVVNLDAPVAEYWPEFGTRGKERITVRQLSSHQAGLPAFDEVTTMAELADWDLCTSRLAMQEPLWEPGTGHGYHALTIGYLLGEVLRRVSGRSVGQLFQERFATPLGLDAWIGLPESEIERVVALTEVIPTGGVGGSLADAEQDPSTLTGRAFTNPVINTENFDRSSAYCAEIPAAGGVADARSLARAYAALVDGPLRSIAAGIVELMGRTVVWGDDLVLIDQPTHFGTAFMLAAPREPMLGHGCLGHNGRGGSLAFAHPESGISYGFVANRMVLAPGPDRRNIRLLTAIRDAIR